MGLNKPITVGVGLTAAEVQSIIDAQTTAIAGKVDAQTDTLKTDIPSSISGGASISEIESTLDAKLPQYSSGAVVKSKQIVTSAAYSTNDEIANYAVQLFNKGLLPKLYLLEKTNSSGLLKIIPYNISEGGVEGSITDYIIDAIANSIGIIKMSPVDKSKSLIYSKRNGFFDNRDFDSGNISRGSINLNLNSTADVTCTDGVIRYQVMATVAGTYPAESIMCLEFN